MTRSSWSPGSAAPGTRERRTPSAARRAAKGAGLLLFAGAAAFLAVGPASAASTDWQVLTSDSGTPGGIAQWEGPDTFRVCDNQSDGLRAWGRASWGDGFTSSTTLQDANGSRTCVTGHTNSLPSGVPLRMEICLRDGATGPLRYCVTETGEA